MTQSTLESAMSVISTNWGPLTTERIEMARSQIEALANASPAAPPTRCASGKASPR